MKIIKILKKNGSIDEKKLYSLKEVADFFDVTPTTILKWVEKGIFKCTKFGRQTFITDDEIIRIQNQNINLETKQ